MTGLAETITRAKGGSWRGSQGLVPTPGHSAKDRGLSIKDNAAGDDIILHCFNDAAFDWRGFKAQLRAEGLLPDCDAPRSIRKAAPKATPPATYFYCDAKGDPLFRVRRTKEKTFLCAVPDGRGGWVSGMNGVEPALYRLPELLAAAPALSVYLCAGEKDADNVAALGLVATTIPFGELQDGKEGNWRAAYTMVLKGREVVLLQDNDKAGREHVTNIGSLLLAAGIDYVPLLLPGLTDKGDVSDWLAAGGTAAKLVELAAEAWREQAAKPSAPSPGWESLTADTLAAMIFPELRWAIPGIIPEGLTLLAGKPKFGKSFLALGTGIAVASGGFAFNAVRCDEGDVLYCALEDSPRRLHDRLHKMLPHGRMPARLHFMTMVPRLGEGLIERLDGWLDAHPRAKMIVLDTWRCIKPAVMRGGSAYDEDASGIAPLHALATSRPGLAVVVIHHTRKLEADDPFDTISGTFGLTGVADTLIVLAKHGEGAKLSAQGRDLDGYEKALNRDSATGGWLMAGDARELAKTGERQAILDVLHEAEGETLSLATIASATGKKKDNLAKLLKRLIDEGLIEKVSYGKYRSKSLSNYSNRSNSDDQDDDFTRGLNSLNELNGGSDND